MQEDFILVYMIVDLSIVPLSRSLPALAGRPSRSYKILLTSGFGTILGKGLL